MKKSKPPKPLKTPDSKAPTRGDRISEGRLLRSPSKRTRAERKQVIEEDYGHLPIR